MEGNGSYKRSFENREDVHCVECASGAYVQTSAPVVFTAVVMPVPLSIGITPVVFVGGMEAMGAVVMVAEFEGCGGEAGEAVAGEPEDCASAVEEKRARSAMRANMIDCDNERIAMARCRRMSD
jgi:hypothetical protein